MTALSQDAVVNVSGYGAFLTHRFALFHQPLSKSSGILEAYKQDMVEAKRK